MESVFTTLTLPSFDLHLLVPTFLILAFVYYGWLYILFSITPWMLGVYLISDEFYHQWPKVSHQMWIDFLMPVVAVLQLVTQHEFVGTITVAVCLALHYILDLNNRKDLSRSIRLHHWLSVVMIGGALWYTMVSSMFYDQTTLDVHMACTRYLLFSEVSTIFLNLRPILKKYNQPRAWVTWVFFSTFIIVRFGPAYFVLTEYPFIILWWFYVAFLTINVYWATIFLCKHLIY
jgi:hypothetical protein